MLVGGMPQAVNAYLDTNNFSKVEQVKRRILYENLVAQMLVAAGNELFYHTWPRDEKHYFAKNQETIMLPAYMVPFL